ncbi:hypothetical protein ACFY1J_06500 [Streptomyces sp. NPDC001406]|uniref:hypothetical protein n=1 Tax=Streptomyces sp. NPDC001406 TaxID=3364572 RepID=UPI003699429C
MASGDTSTVREVAARAGACASTVSRVLGSTCPVTAAIRARGLTAKRKLDHVVNGHVRAPGAATNKTIGVVDDVTGPFRAHIARGVEEQAAAEGRAPTWSPWWAGLGVSTTGGCMTRVVHGLDRAGSRLVLVGRPQLGPGMPATVIDHYDEGGACALTGHVRRPATTASPTSAASAATGAPWLAADFVG